MGMGNICHPRVKGHGTADIGRQEVRHDWDIGMRSPLPQEGGLS